MHVLSHDAGELASSSSSSFLGTDEAQTSSSSNSAMGQAVATFPLSFLMPNCSALQDLDQQVVPALVSLLCHCPSPPTTLLVKPPARLPTLAPDNLQPVFLPLNQACLPALHVRDQHDVTHLHAVTHLHSWSACLTCSNKAS